MMNPIDKAVGGAGPADADVTVKERWLDPLRYRKRACHNLAIATQPESNMNKQEMDKLMQELIECSEGRRGWVCVNKARASRIGIAHELVLGSARAFALRVAPHGRMGWTASRA